MFKIGDKVTLHGYFSELTYEEYQGEVGTIIHCPNKDRSEVYYVVEVPGLPLYKYNNREDCDYLIKEYEMELI